MKFFLPSLLLASMLLTGCAATVQESANDAPIKTAGNSAKHIALNVTGSKKITDSGDWEQFKGEWRAAMKSAAAAIGAVFSSEEGSAVTSGESGTLVVVNINDYRYVSPGARYGFGVLTGNAYVDSSVQFRDLKTGALLGERKYNTSSSAWQGIFAPMTEKQVQAIATQIVNEIK